MLRKIPYLLLLMAMLCAQLSFAASQLSTISFNPETDVPKLAKEIGVAPEKIDFHAKAIYFKLPQWMPAARMDDLYTAVYVMTDDRIIFAQWDSQAQVYKEGLVVPFAEISAMALLQEQSKDQLELTTPAGLLAVRLSTYKKGAPVDTTPTIRAFEFLKARNVPVTQSQGRIELYRPDNGFQLRFRK